MATQEPSEADTAAKMDVQLEEFSGTFCPGVCFASGHCFWLFKWDRTPTSLGAYSDIWIITPDGDRLLYADPPEAGPIVEKYHDFDSTTGATITWERLDDDAVMFHMDSDDTTLQLRADLGSSTGTRVLNTISALTPRAVLRTSIGQKLSNLSLNTVMNVNGLKVAGITERQEPYRFEADQMWAVTDASATLNGDDLGECRPPDRPIDFGDAKTPDDPFVAAADVYLQPPDE